MSRYTIDYANYTEVDEDGDEYVLKMKYVYGYDNQLKEYFLQLWTVDYGKRGDHPIRISDDAIGLVGELSNLVGNKGNFMEVCERVGIWNRIPEEHQTLVAMDLPIDGDGWKTLATLRGDGK